jgi:hypothetical protein
VQDLDTPTTLGADSLESLPNRLETVLTRLASRYRAMPESKLLGRLSDGRSRAAAGHELASLLALAAQGVEDRARPLPPAWRSLPFEGPFVVGDQLGVTGHDLLAAYARLGADSAAAATAVWAPPGVRCDRTGVGTVLDWVLTAAEDLVRVL